MEGSIFRSPIMNRSLWTEVGGNTVPPLSFLFQIQTNPLRHPNTPTLTSLNVQERSSRVGRGSYLYKRATLLFRGVGSGEWVLCVQDWCCQESINGPLSSLTGWMDPPHTLTAHLAPYVTWGKTNRYSPTPFRWISIACFSWRQTLICTGY